VSEPKTSPSANVVDHPNRTPNVVAARRLSGFMTPSFDFHANYFAALRKSPHRRAAQAL
jgi:hypothetical protein